jgi:hypothetical protein
MLKPAPHSAGLFGQLNEKDVVRMARSDVLVDAGYVQAHGSDPGVVLVEVDEDTSAYDQGHLRKVGVPIEKDA